MSSKSDHVKTSARPSADTTKKPSPARQTGEHDRHKVENIAKAGREHFDPNEENEG